VAEPLDEVGREASGEERIIHAKRRVVGPMHGVAILESRRRAGISGAVQNHRHS
jgi:hypothetical protein